MKLHLCCGPINLLPGWINVDACNFGQEVTADLSQPWLFAKDASIEQILCEDGFEHLPSAEHFLAESARVLTPGGTLTIWVPHYKNPSAYRVTHLRLCSWNYFSVFPEAHDATQSLRVIRNRLFIGSRHSGPWTPFHWLINLMPKWWERFFYASNIEVVMEKVASPQ